MKPGPHCNVDLRIKTYTRNRGFVKIWKTRHKISADMRIFLQRRADKTITINAMNNRCNVGQRAAVRWAKNTTGDRRMSDLFVYVRRRARRRPSSVRRAFNACRRPAIAAFSRSRRRSTDPVCSSFSSSAAYDGVLERHEVVSAVGRQSEDRLGVRGNGRSSHGRRTVGDGAVRHGGHQYFEVAVAAAATASTCVSRASVFLCTLTRALPWPVSYTHLTLPTIYSV